LVSLKYLTSDVEPSDPNGGDEDGDGEQAENSETNEVSDTADSDAGEDADTDASASTDADSEPKQAAKDEELAFFLGKKYPLISTVLCSRTNFEVNLIYTGKSVKSTTSKVTKKSRAPKTPRPPREEVEASDSETPEVGADSEDAAPVVSTKRKKKSKASGVSTLESSAGKEDSQSEGGASSEQEDSAEEPPPSRRRGRSSAEPGEDVDSEPSADISIDSGSDADNDADREADDDRAKKSDRTDGGDADVGSDTTEDGGETVDKAKGIISFPQSARNERGPLREKSVAIMQVHLEGNVGDQMETLPLLMKLNTWGVTVDCYLSTMLNKRKRLDPQVKQRVSPYVRNIYENGIGYDLDVRAQKYDVIIVAPGPPVHEVSHCITAVKGESANITMVWFLSAVTPRYCTMLHYIFCLYHICPFSSTDFPPQFFRTEIAYDKQKYW
jgi:hypothetical protein